MEGGRLPLRGGDPVPWHATSIAKVFPTKTGQREACHHAEDLLKAFRLLTATRAPLSAFFRVACSKPAGVCATASGSLLASPPQLFKAWGPSPSPDPGVDLLLADNIPHSAGGSLKYPSLILSCLAGLPTQPAGAPPSHPSGLPEQFRLRPQQLVAKHPTRYAVSVAPSTRVAGALWR